MLFFVSALDDLVLCSVFSRVRFVYEAVVSPSPPGTPRYGPPRVCGSGRLVGWPSPLSSIHDRSCRLSFSRQRRVISGPSSGGGRLLFRPLPFVASRLSELGGGLVTFHLLFLLLFLLHLTAAPTMCPSFLWIWFVQSL